MLRWLKSLWKPILTEVLQTVLTPYLERRGKLADAMRYALIARAMATELCVQYPTWEAGRLVQALVEMLAQQWPLPKAVLSRIATQALVEARGGVDLAAASGDSGPASAPLIPRTTTPSPRARG